MLASRRAPNAGHTTFALDNAGFSALTGWCCLQTLPRRTTSWHRGDVPTQLECVRMLLVARCIMKEDPNGGYKKK